MRSVKTCFKTYIEAKGSPQTAVSSIDRIDVDTLVQKTNTLVRVSLISGVKKSGCHSEENSSIGNREHKDSKAMDPLEDLQFRVEKEQQMAREGRMGGEVGWVRG